MKNKIKSAVTTFVGIAVLFAAVFIFAATMKTISLSFRRANAETVKPLSEVAKSFGGKNTDLSIGPDGGMFFYCKQGDFETTLLKYEATISVQDNSLSEDDRNHISYRYLGLTGDGDPHVIFSENGEDKVIPKTTYDLIFSILKENASKMKERESWDAY